MRPSRWLRALDARNQRTIDAELGRIEPDGPGVVAVVRPLDPAESTLKYQVWVRVDDGKRRPLPWGTSFLALPPGRHRIEFAYVWGAVPFKWRSPQTAVVDVPSDGQVWLEYRTGPTSWSTPTLEMR